MPTAAKMYKQRLDVEKAENERISKKLRKAQAPPTTPTKREPFRLVREIAKRLNVEEELNSFKRVLKRYKIEKQELHGTPPVGPNISYCITFTTRKGNYAKFWVEVYDEGVTTERWGHFATTQESFSINLVRTIESVVRHADTPSTPPLGY